MGSAMKDYHKVYNARLCQRISGINQTRQFQSEIAGLMKWIGDVESFINEQVVDGDPESLEVQLDQCEVW